MLKDRGIRVFFDDYERGLLWGKDLYEHLTEVYQYRCEFCVMFVSHEYASKVWPNAERRSAQARAVKEKQEYILPAKFDDVEVPGLLDTVGYIDLTKTSPTELSELIAEKLGTPTREEYLPPTLDRLLDRFENHNGDDTFNAVIDHAWSFFQVLRRMNTDERDAVLNLVRFGCPSNLPEDIHINADLLRRHTHMSVPRLESLLGGIESLGFRCTIRKDEEHDAELPGLMLGEPYFFHLKWINLHGDTTGLPELVVVRRMIEIRN